MWGNDCTTVLGAGRYRNSGVVNGCQLVLDEPGQYDFESLSVWAGGSLVITAGPVEIRTNREFSLGDDSTVTGVSGASDLAVYSNGTIRFGRIHVDTAKRPVYFD